MSKIRISAVSYTNSKPFVYGIEHSDILRKIDLSLDIPSDCAKKLIEDQADIGLVPVAALLQIPNHKIISDFCIGANGAVNSVFIFSDKSIDDISMLRLDSESRTSNALAKILLQKHWKNNRVQYINSGKADAYVEIGDRTFGKKNEFLFVYDLAEIWKEFTGLPFAFAVWASNKAIPEAFLEEFNAALKLGIDNIPTVIKALPEQKKIDLGVYLTQNLDYPLTDDKRRAIELFLGYLAETVAD